MSVCQCYGSFFTLWLGSVYCVTFETECKWYVRQNWNSCPNKIRGSTCFFHSQTCTHISHTRFQCHSTYLEIYLSSLYIFDIYCRILTFGADNFVGIPSSLHDRITRYSIYSIEFGKILISSVADTTYFISTLTQIR